VWHTSGDRTKWECIDDLRLFWDRFKFIYAGKDTVKVRAERGNLTGAEADCDTFVVGKTASYAAIIFMPHPPRLRVSGDCEGDLTPDTPYGRGVCPKWGGFDHACAHLY